MYKIVTSEFGSEKKLIVKVKSAQELRNTPEYCAQRRFGEHFLCSHGIDAREL